MLMGSCYVFGQAHPLVIPTGNREPGSGTAGPLEQVLYTGDLSVRLSDPGYASYDQDRRLIRIYVTVTVNSAMGVFDSDSFRIKLNFALNGTPVLFYVEPFGVEEPVNIVGLKENETKIFHGYFLVHETFTPPGQPHKGPIFLVAISNQVYIPRVQYKIEHDNHPGNNSAMMAIFTGYHFAPYKLPDYN